METIDQASRGSFTDALVGARDAANDNPGLHPNFAGFEKDQAVAREERGEPTEPYARPSEKAKTIPEPAEHKSFRATDKKLREDYLGWRKGITGEDEAPEAKAGEAQPEAKPEQKAETQPESPEEAARQNAAKAVQELDERLLGSVKPDDPAHETLSQFVEANKQHAAHPIVQGMKHLLVQASGRYAGEDLKAVAGNLMKLARQPFDATAEGYARHQVLGAAIGNTPNRADVLLFLAEPRNADIVRSMWNATPQAIGAAVHAISRDLMWMSPPSKQEQPSAPPETKANRPPSQVGGHASAPPDALEASSRKRDFRGVEAELTRRYVEKRGRF